MPKTNRFHIVVDVNRQFVASGTIIAGPTRTDCTFNVDEDGHVREAALAVLLIAAHAICDDDKDKLALLSLLAEYGVTDPSPVRHKRITAEEAADTLADED